MVESTGDNPAEQRSTPVADDGPAASLPLCARVARRDTVVFTDLEDTVIMLDTDEGQYYELDPVATRIWHLLEAEPTVDALVQALTREYDVDPDTCRSQVTPFLREILALGLAQSMPHTADRDGA